MSTDLKSAFESNRLTNLKFGGKISDDKTFKHAHSRYEYFVTTFN